MTKSGRLIRDTRVRFGILQRTLAERMGCHAQQLSNIENGHVLCPLQMGKRIAFELGISAQKMKKVLAEDLIERKWNGTRTYTEST